MMPVQFGPGYGNSFLFFLLLCMDAMEDSIVYSQ